MALAPLVCCFAAGHVATMGWVPGWLERLLPFVRSAMLGVPPYRNEIAHATVCALYAAHVLTVRWHHRQFPTTKAPPGFLALMVLHGLLMLDGCVAVLDPAVTLPEHQLVARSCAVGNAALFAHLMCGTHST